jgi:hypothetical protein
MRRRFARETYQYRSYGYNISGIDGMVTHQEKGPWRATKATALADASEIDREWVVVQKVRIGITKILETTTVKGGIPTA